MKKINATCVRRYKLWRNIRFSRYIRARSLRLVYQDALDEWYYKPLGWWKKNKFAVSRCRCCLESSKKRHEKIADLNFQDMLVEIDEWWWEL
jgi:hypothetical protein